MKLHLVGLGTVLLVGSVIATGSTTACSSSSGSSSSSSGSGSSSSGSGSRSGSTSRRGSSSGGSACEPPPGTYTTTYTAAAGSNQNCPALSSNTETFPNDAGLPDAGGVMCTANCAPPPLTDTCSSSTGGATFSTTTTITFNSTGATGTVSENLDGVMCSYTLVATKN